MADVSVKLGVSGISQFKQGMNDAQAAVKGIDAALKLNEKQLKASGNAENELVSRTELLNRKLEAQKTIVKNAEQALKQMEQNGVKQTSKAYQDMQTRMIEAQSAMLDTQQEMTGLGNKATEASGKTDKLVTSLGGLNKKVSLEQVIGVVDKLTGGLERAGKKAVDVGKQIWENIIDTARYSDDIATEAMKLDMTPEQYQKYKGVFDTIGELTVQEWQKAKQKVQKAIHDPTQEQTDLLALLGIETHEVLQGKMGAVEGAAKGFEEVFWELGDVLKQKVKSGELTQDLADTYANTLFGKSFAELKPMWDLGAEEFQAAVDKQAAASNEAIQKNAELSDAVTKLQNSFTALKTEVLGEMAPALTGAAQSLDGMLSTLMEYLKTDQGKEMLEKLGTAVEGLFKDLSNIDPQQVVEGFTGVFNTVIEGLKWLNENKGTVIGALEAIVLGWGALELTGAALDIVKLVQGIAGLSGGAAAAEGAAAGASWGTAFAGAVAKAAPWLLFLYKLLKPNENTNDKLGNSSLTDENGNLTPEAEKYGFRKDENGELYQDRREIISKAVQDAWDLYRANQFAQEDMTKLHTAVNNNELFSQITRLMYETSRLPGGLNIEDLDLSEVLKGMEPPKVEVDPEAPEDAAQQLSDEIGTVNVPVVYVPTNGDVIRKIRTPAGMGWHANGLWSVPFDGYMAVLHKGEQILPAREVASRNFTSNTYFENVNIQNGTDADGLAARVAAEQRRTMNAFGGG